MNTAHGRIQKATREGNSKQNLENPPVFAKPCEDRLDHVDAMIVGPPDTPYEFGFFKFGTSRAQLRRVRPCFVQRSYFHSVTPAQNSNSPRRIRTFLRA